MKFQELIRYYQMDEAPSGNKHRRRGWVQIDCPYCGKDSKKFHLGFRESAGYFNCWKCGKLPLQKTLVLLFPISWGQANEYAKTFKLDTDAPDQIKPPKVVGKFQEPYGVGRMGPRHKRYLESRHFDAKTIEDTWGVGGIEHSPEASWSLYIPIHFQGEVVSWTSRKISDNVDKRYHSAALSQEKIEHKQILYGWDFVGNSVIVHEGPTDVWRTGKGSVGTFGTSFTSGQLRLLITVPRRLICFDNSDDAQNRAEILASLLSPFDGVTEIVRLNAKDPGSAKAKETRQLRELAGLS